ncbi:endolytic transglycosylase MltG [Bacillus swezeyi]|uniref:Endolytic murein transglycosylase n=1 Tax=Bacillus swezeyi TaxID=1925020 RepID=A0A5M8RJN9_9BACI|nr:endolytic transglycosylase MltG [Bacillus swezeyi]KAA6448797.1 endolytic transglycosylase MltG [Bacillus swezeyi]KAA6481907.1 endolytic transglycosylase MltG [Bacillus swezeyi]TYS35111.1 endolytic transglycosylase MltG [Bacillus swezeyi]
MFKDQTKKSFIKKLLNHKIKFWLAVAAVLLILGAGGFSLYVKTALEPVDKNSQKMVNIYIPKGSTVSSIAAKLKEQHLIKNEKVFIAYVKFKNASGFQAGNFQLSQSMDSAGMIEKLTSASHVPAFKIVIPEGRQLSEIADIIAGETNFSKQDIINKLDDREFIETLKKKYPKLITDEVFSKNVKHPLEGYLYPATYPFYDPDTKIEAIIEAMIKQTEKLAEKYQPQMSDQKMTVHKTLTMASLIEEEATEKADRHKISSVFYNRLAKKMPLQTDPTVLYALGKHKNRVVYKDLEANSPYNTYKNTGLPPGPISNAGETSWEAALNPDKTEYVYFLAKKNGEVVFTKTLEEHNHAKSKYITNTQ